MIEQEELIKKGKLNRDECFLDFKDAKSGKRRARSRGIGLPGTPILIAIS